MSAAEDAIRKAKEPGPWHNAKVHVVDCPKCQEYNGRTGLWPTAEHLKEAK